MSQLSSGTRSVSNACCRCNAKLITTACTHTFFFTLQVLLRQEGRGHSQVTRTPNSAVILTLPEGGTYIIEVRAVSEGGEGAASAQVRLLTSSGKSRFPSHSELVFSQHWREEHKCTFGWAIYYNSSLTILPMHTYTTTQVRFYLVLKRKNTISKFTIIIPLRLVTHFSTSSVKFVSGYFVLLCHNYSASFLSYKPFPLVSFLLYTFLQLVQLQALNVATDSI